MNCQEHDISSLWHDRFKEQLAWTSVTRDFIYRKLKFASRSSFLEIGCGTGALSEEIIARFVVPARRRGQGTTFVGIDHASEFITQCELILGSYRDVARFQVAEATNLPVDSESMDVVFCHYFLMWNDDQRRARIIDEARRVLVEGGWFVCFAEPDYLGWILEPESRLKELLMRSLMNAGGDLTSGRKLARDLAPFAKAFVGSASTPWTSSQLREMFETEWNFYENLLAGRDEMDEAIDAIKRADLDAIDQGVKFSFLPVFYGFGQKKA
jgi:SAM-dependent methyltransferase